MIRGPGRERARATALQRGLLALTLLLVGCGSADKEVPASRPSPPAGLSGNSAFGADELREGLANQPSSTFTTRPFDAAAFQGDLDRVVNFYHSRGYFDARVLETRTTPDGIDKVRVTVTLAEGLPSSVSSLEITGLTGLPPEAEKALAHPYPLEVGKVFREQDYLATKTDLARRLLDQAYLTVQVEGQAEVNRLAHRVAVHFEVRPGPRYRYSGYQISGAVEIAEANIGTAMESFVSPGHFFSKADLAAAQRRLMGLGVFASVQVVPGVPDPLTATVPIEVRVIEAPAQTLRFGGGVGIDVTHQEVHLLASYTDRNFLGRSAAARFRQHLCPGLGPDGARASYPVGLRGSAHLQVHSPAHPAGDPSQSRSIRAGAGPAAGGARLQVLGDLAERSAPLGT